MGIDLGTTSSALAIIERGSSQPYMLEDEQGAAIIPSLVTLTEVDDGVDRMQVDSMHGRHACHAMRGGLSAWTCS